MSVAENKEGIYTFFRDTHGKRRTIMVLIPHEDDEINLAGTVIYQARKNGNRVICVFVTNGDWRYPAFVRLKEAVKALAVLGVPKEDIVFLGYPDGGSKGQRCLYIQGRNHVFDTGLHKETYGMQGHADFSMQHRHRHQPYTWEGLRTDVKDVITEYKPDVILATDFDSHPDHRMCYFAFLAAMRDILQGDRDYRPLVLMGFCYSTGFEGTADFYGRHLLSSVINKKQRWSSLYETDNPPYEWHKRIRFPVCSEARSLLRHNIIYQALCCHLSQKASRRAVRLVNGDQVFWPRRTDNLIYLGKVTVSSGNGAYLYDFQMMNTHDIAAKQPAMEDYLWIPAADDMGKWCRCDFDMPQHVEAIALYGNIDNDGRILKGRLIFSTGYRCEVGPLKEQGHETMIAVPPQDGVAWVKFEILETEGKDAGLSEWEILSDLRYPFSILQICADGEFAYDWHVYADENPLISAYTYGVSGPLRWFINGQAASLQEINSRVQHLERKMAIRVESISNPSISSEAVFAPAGKRYRVWHELDQYLDKLTVWWEKQMEKRPHHKLRKIKTEEQYNRL